MNAFVNLKKRSISLPKGCKDLADVLKRPDPNQDRAIRQFIRLLLLQAQQDHASELVIGASSVDGDTPIKYEIKGAWYDLAPLPSQIRPALVSELARLAQLTSASSPQEGVLDVSFGNVRLRWKVKLTIADEECLLVPVQD